MSILQAEYQVGIYSSRADWVLTDKFIIEAKLGQSINWGQLANYLRWVSEKGGNVTYITLTVPPPEVVDKATMLADAAGTAVKFITLTPF